MIAPGLTGDDDLRFENGDWVWIDGDEELIQSVESILKTRLTEFELDLEHGLRHDNLFGKHTDKNALRDDLIEAVSQEKRIRSVEDIAIIEDKSNRTRWISLVLQKETEGDLITVDFTIAEGGG